MALSHATSGEIVSLHPLGELLADTKTHTLVKTPSLEVIRLVMPAGKMLAEHQAPGEITVQCLEGDVRFYVDSQERLLTAGDWLYLEAGVRHALSAVSDSSLLVTLLLPVRAAAE
jgi:quercetin dioxygenase-like cupin family protein